MVVELTKQNTELLKKEEVVFVDFYAPWCGPCMMLKPIFENIASQYNKRALFCQANVDNLRDLSIEHRVTSIPTMICLKNGKPVWTHTGTISEAELKKAVETHI